MYKRCLGCAEYIKSIIGDFVPETAVILGSGLGGFCEKIGVKFSVDFKDIKGFPASTVNGHKGRLLFGTYCGKNVAIAEGRVHLYEGYSAAETVIPVRVLKLLGVKNIILTNAAGGINKDLKPGDIMMICDHISLFTDSPLSGVNIEEFGTRFPDMTSVYDGELGSIASAAAYQAKTVLKTGVYAQLRGPQYETPAEIRALLTLGADAVGMSTVAEAIAARHCGLRVCAFSVITNMAAGINKSPLSHSEVIEGSKKAQGALFAVIGGIINGI